MLGLKQQVHELERQREEEEEARGCEGGEDVTMGGWEGVKEGLKSALHLPVLSEDEYIAIRGKEGGEREDMQSMTDYIRVS